MEISSTTPTDAQIEDAFDLVLVEHGDQGDMANLQATVSTLRVLVGWDEGEAEAVFRCGVQVYGWNWDDYGHFAREGGFVMKALEVEHLARIEPRQGRWVATCSCGVTIGAFGGMTVFDTMDAARDAAVLHVREEAGQR